MLRNLGRIEKVHGRTVCNSLGASSPSSLASQFIKLIFAFPLISSHFPFPSFVLARLNHSVDARSIIEEVGCLTSVQSELMINIGSSSDSDRSSWTFLKQD